ncbi:L-2-hydroxyglutarate oxidase [Rubricoccus marinus]|uniref:Hydroxyglutarate oxidase n=1 Tax=Rubricoccus marinus TaxID=716817 RepID=A0A259U077_9BACT|nr:L-2-hydroxyglutarate oxidase [Rubricoccus marinus]OZC03224.1 hydroxyglutarate oxidase [Rubricoccus marinus]
MPKRVVIIGGGIVGLATARALVASGRPLAITILEKESTVATHQTGRNSGVLHAGLYYRPGSRKARLCREGKAEMEAYCTERGIPWTRSGKLVVAVAPEELPRLEALRERAGQNGVEVERLAPEAMREREPHVSGVGALWVPETGVVDYGVVSRALAAELREAGVDIQTGVAVTGGHETASGVVVETEARPVDADVLVNCAGLFADRVARLFGVAPEVLLVPFRGEYADLAPQAHHLVRGLIYPVPDPAFPFLGVHLTRSVDGHVHAGPSAALAFAREGYTFGTLKVGELAESLGARGFRTLARQHWRMGLGELGRSVSLGAFWRAARRLVPELKREHVARGSSGVRAQAVRPDGSLADDFVIEQTRRAVHVINAPSPAATASLAIGREIAAEALARA